MISEKNDLSANLKIVFFFSKNADLKMSIGEDFKFYLSRNGQFDVADPRRKRRGFLDDTRP